VAQAGARQALHQQVELADQLAVEASAIARDLFQAMTDFLGQLAVLGLLEALGIALQQVIGLVQFTHAAVIPLAALQALPDLEQLAGLVDHALG
jgi:hypothetical protein